MILTSVQLGEIICRVLGIDPTHVRRITIEADAGKVAAVMVERYVTDDDIKRIFSEIEIDHYVLIRK